MQAALDGLFRQQAGAEHQRRIRSIRAAGDRGDDHRAVRKLEFVAVVLHGDVLLRGALERLFERRFRLPQRHAVLRALRPGERGLDGGEIEFQLVGVNRVRRGIGAENALRLGVFLDEAHARCVAAGEAQIGKRFGVHGEEAHRRAIFGRHVGDRGAVRQAQAGEPGAVELDEFSDHALFAQHFGDDQHEVGRRRALGQAAVQLEADHFGDQHRKGWPSIAASASMPPTPQPKTPRPLTIVVCESVPTSESGNACVLPSTVRVEHDARQIFEIHLVANAGIRRNDLEIVQGFLSPAQEGVALDVALKFEFRVEREGHVGAELVHLHGVVDHQFRGQQGIHFFRIAAQRANRFAHRGEIDDGGHAGKILQQHARGHEGNFLLRRGVGIPAGQRLDISGMNESPVLLAQKIFQQHAE